MPWVTESYIRIVDGKKKVSTRRVWKPDPKPVKKTPIGDAAAANQSAAQLAAIKKRAAGLSDAERKRLARKKMWDALQRRAREIRGTISRPTQVGTGNPGLAVERADMERDKAIADAKKKADDATAQRWTAMAKYYAIKERQLRDRKDLERAKKQVGTKWSGVILERLVRQARERQKESGGTDLDTAYIQELDEAYQEHVLRVSTKYKTEVEKLRTFFKTDKNGNLVAYTNKDAYLEAQKILSSKDFIRLESEYLRLFGQGQGQGTLTTVWDANRSPIAEDQRMYLAQIDKQRYIAAYNKLQENVARLNRVGEYDAAAKLMRDWMDGDQYLFEFSKTLIDPAKTTKKYVITEDGRRVLVSRTVEEEFEYRRSQYAAEMQRQYDLWKSNQALRRNANRMRSKQLLNSPGYRQQSRDAQALIDVLQTMGMKDGPTTREEMNKVVDAAMQKWESENRKWFRLDEKKSYSRIPDAQFQRNVQAWNKAREAQRARFYGVFGTEAPGLGETVLEFAPVKGLLTAFGGAAGAIPSGVRAVALVTTGNSQIQVGIRTESLPDKVREEYMAWVRGGQLTDPYGLPLTTAPNPRNPLGIFSAGNATGQTFGFEAGNPLTAWLATDEGKKWYAEYQKNDAADRYAQDKSFYEGFYGDGDIWKKLEALGTYGTHISNADWVNALSAIALDPTNAIPLKATTWLARYASAKKATEGITGLAGLKRLGLGAKHWATVTEPELRFERALKPYIKALEDGADPSTVREMILTKLSGIVDGPSRAKETEKLFRQFGIDPKSQSGHMLSSLVEDAIVGRLKAAGVDYRDVAAHAREIEAQRIAKEAAEKAERSKVIDVADARRVEVETIARTEAERASSSLAAERAAEAARLAERARNPRPPRTILQRSIDDPLRRPSTTEGHTDPVIINLQSGDPLRRAVTEGIVFGRPRDTEDAAAIVTAVNDIGGVNRLGFVFGPGKMTDDFFASQDYQELRAALDSPDPEVRGLAEETLYEISRRTMSDYVARQELPGVRLVDGRIPWRTTPRGQFTVIGGRASHQQYIPTRSDLLTRAGAHSAGEEVIVAAELRAFDELKTRFSLLRHQYETRMKRIQGRIDDIQKRIEGGAPRDAYRSTLAKLKGELADERAAYLAKLREDIVTMGVRRRSERLSEDIAAGLGQTVHGELERILEGLDDFIPTGGLLYEDFMAAGHINNYYATFSLLPGMMSGPGYETQLMENILNPGWRAQFTRSKFTRLLMTKMFSATETITPASFRANGMHLFALFHMTVLDGNIKLLESYSKSIETLLKHDKFNIYGRMWKVMETRIGVPWADSFLVSERAFSQAAIYGKRLHPNLALAMIPVGPIARHTPIGHGYTGHLRALATTLDPLYKISPPGWTDELAIDALSAIASRRLSIEDGFSKATQFIHYVMARYGSSVVRARFFRVIQDFSIEATYRTMKDTYSFQLLRSRYIEARLSNTRLVPDDETELEILRTQDFTTDLAAREFDSLFTEPNAGRMRSRAKTTRQRREFRRLHRLYEDAYWANEVTHDNPGLHTSKFLQVMADPNLQKGDSWVRYASSYYDHMAAIGPESEALAQNLLKTLFEPDIARVARDAYEQITDAGRTGVLTAERQTFGMKIDFMFRAGLLGDIQRYIDEGNQRVHADESYAQQEIDNIAMHNKWIEDDAAEVAAREDTTASLYDFADLEDLTIRAGAAAADLRKAAVELSQLSEQARRPSTRVDAAVKSFHRFRKRTNDIEAMAFLRNLPDDVGPWVRLELRRLSAVRRLERELSRAVFRTMDVGSIPESVGKQLEELVALVDAVPGGKNILASFASRYHRYLFRSRLSDYVRHEEWFKFMEDRSARNVSDLHAAPRRILEEISSVRSKLARNIEKEATGSEREALEAKLARLEAELAEARRLVDEDVASRPASETPAPETTTTSPEGVAEEAPIGPTPGDLNGPSISMSQRALEIFRGMREEDWLNRELLRAQRRIRSTPRHTPEYAALVKRMDDIKKAFKVIEVSRSGGKGSYVPPVARKTFVSTVLSLAGDRAKAMLRPNQIASYVSTAPGVYVEQGRWLYRLLRSAPVDERLLTVRPPGRASDTYVAHREEIERVMGLTFSAPMLARFGIPEHLLSEISGTMLMTNLDEFHQTLKHHPEFSEFVTQVASRMDARLKTITGDSSYTLSRWLDDRLVHRSDYMDIREYERLDRIVTVAIEKARLGAKRTGQLDLRQRPGTRGEDPLTELFESDIRAVIGKAKALAEEGVDPHAYNEARKVFRTSMTRKNRALGLVARASRAASDEMAALGKSVDDADWDSVYREAYDRNFLAFRKIDADEEALNLLDALARDEMFGSPVSAIIKEFEDRYGMDMVVKGFEPSAISPFQRRSLEEAVKTLLHVTDLDDKAQMVVGLSRHGQRPPFNNRAAMREWLSKYGFWSPRTATEIESGKKSWSIQEEFKYYEDNWATAPEWADYRLLEEGGELEHILFDEVAYGEANRAWGLFNRNMEARFATGKMTREERARFLVEGSEALGIKAKRDLALERQYVMDRYGPLVTDEAGNLKAFPWLMNRDELRAFVSSRSSKSIPDGIVSSVEELNILTQIIDMHVSKYFEEFAMKGVPATYEDVFTMTANIVSDMLKNPIWARRDRDALGRFLRGQAALRRALVFTQLGFLTTNVIDTFIKGPWAAFTTRSFRVGSVSKKAESLSLIDFGFERGGQLLRDTPVRGTARWREAGKGIRYKLRDGKVVAATPRQLSMARVIERVLSFTELPAQGAGMAEDGAKLRLAQGMYDGAYAKALSKLKDPELADAAARAYVRDEINRFWPTVGDGPIERLFNTISPFISYQFKNRMVFLSEIAGHPAIFNYFNRIGDAIEEENRRRWAEERPNEVLPARLARLVELPFAPGVFIDFGQFSDIQRGLKPLYEIADGKAVLHEFASQFIRLAGPNDINFVYGIFNALGLPARREWVQGRENGYPNGVWIEVDVPWEAPWGAVANSFNSFWPVEIGQQFIKAMESKWSAQELTKLFFQTMFFGGLKSYDKGAGLNSFFYALKASDPDAAEAWLKTADGLALQAWWLDKAASSYEFFTPQKIKDILNPKAADPNPWFHSKSEEFQAKVKQGFEDLRLIREKWDRRVWSLTPGTEEYRQAKLMYSTERYRYYQEHPWMYEYQAYSMTPSEWAKQLDDWQVDDLVESYFNMKAPKSGDYKTAVLWQEAVARWKQQRQMFLRTFPQVAERLGQARNSMELEWRRTEEGWFDVLDRVGTRSIAIEAAQQAEDFDLVEQLYLINDLDFNVLSEDQAVYYFDPTTDFKTIPNVGPDDRKVLKSGPFGQSLLPKLKILPDFNEWRFSRMTLEEKAIFERDQKYIDGIRGVIAKAKASDNFGATFVNELKKHPELLAEYFRRNPGKREQWAANDEYIRLISKYGILAKQGRFAEAGRYFDSLPDWVRARYYEKHPERRQRAQENMRYMSYMEKWVAFYKRRDYEGGAAFFDKLPEWVKDRYFAKHPDKKGLGGGSAYAKAMGKWVELLQAGKKDEAKAYFASLPQAYKDRYYAKHPEQKLRDDIKRVGQLGQYFAADDANRVLYLQQNPEFAKWLAAQGDDESTRRMMIMAAYRALPPDDQWLRRVFREKYPEIFSKEAKGEASLRKTYAFLAEHPDMLPSFEKWLDAVWASYDESIRKSASPPKPWVVSDHSRTRRHGLDRKRPHRGRSAAWVRLHSLS